MWEAHCVGRETVAMLSLTARVNGFASLRRVGGGEDEGELAAVWSSLLSMGGSSLGRGCATYCCRRSGCGY